MRRGAGSNTQMSFREGRVDAPKNTAESAILTRSTNGGRRAQAPSRQAKQCLSAQCRKRHDRQEDDPILPSEEPAKLFDAGFTEHGPAPFLSPLRHCKRGARQRDGRNTEHHDCNLPKQRGLQPLLSRVSRQITSACTGSVAPKQHQPTSRPRQTCYARFPRGLYRRTRPLAT